MSRSKTNYSLMRNTDAQVQRYVEENGFEFERHSEYHTKIKSPNVVLNLWTGSGKYYIEKTDFRNTGVIERQGEKGYLPTKQAELFDFLNRLFFAIDMI